MAEDQQVVGRPIDDERDQRGQERTQAAIADQDAIDAAQCGPENQCQQDCQSDRQLQNVHQVQRAQIAEREHRPDREIDAADDHDKRKAQHDQTDFTRLAQDVRDAGGSEKAWNAVGQPQHRAQQDDDGHGRLHPPLGQDLAEKVIRPILVSKLEDAIDHQNFLGRIEGAVQCTANSDLRSWATAMPQRAGEGCLVIHGGKRESIDRQQAWCRRSVRPVDHPRITKDCSRRADAGP